ncbi:hypothetical protein L1080_030070 [Rhodococcus sp. MSC1_016]|uniref:hypothetical protein n=1 Tax=Rhodococcus sp. MSC1_016 TaxID=2909266 RepID=UPI00202F59A4|nr:hypothetical protein [Rhodococcus sp. MSC1_016]
MAPKDVVSELLTSLSPNGAGQERRSTLQTSATTLTADAAIDDPYIRTMENFHGMSHEEMYSQVQSMVPDAIGELAQACHGISNSLPLAFGFAILRNTISEKWEGAAADAALLATEKLAQTSGQLTSSLAAIAVKLDILSSSAADVKAAVPQPDSSVGILSQLPLSPLAAENSETAREAARLEAVRKLEAIYVPNYRDVGTNVPRLPEPYAPSGAAADGARILGVDGAGSPGATDRSVLNGDGGFTSGTGDSPANGDAATDGQPNANDPAATSAASAEGAGQGGGTGSGSAAGTAAPTTAANSQNAGAAGSGVGGSTNSGGVGGFGEGSRSGSSGPGSGGSGAGGSSTRKRNDKRDSESQGSSVVSGSPIPPGGAAAGAGAGAAAAAAAATPVKPSMSRPGMGMGPGMMGAPGRVGGNGDGDTEHQTPSYLINVDNGNELIGKLDPVAPPVIGA